jgi:hypothetical protein
MIPAALVVLALAPGTAAAPPSLSATDEAAIMRLLCEGTLARDARGWVCTDTETTDGAEPGQQRWHSAWRGRFVEHPGEWIVTLSRTCDFRYCPFDSHVVRKVGGRWRRERPLRLEEDIEYEIGIGDDCVLLAGTKGGLDRLACLDASGPHQGFVFERLRVLSFADGEVAEQLLMARGQGGECFLDPPGKEVRADDVALLADDGRALTVRLRVRAGPCDRSQPDGNGPIALRAEHVLRFVRDGAALKPDAATAEILQRYDWMQTN